MNINTYDKDFHECIQNLSKELKLKEYSEEEYGRQIKEVSMKLKSLDKFGAVTREEFQNVENQARILKLLELQGIKKTLNENIKKETLEEIKNDLANAPGKLDEPKEDIKLTDSVPSTIPTVPTVSVPTIIVPTMCPPPPTPPTFSESKIEEPAASDADCFIVEEKSDIPPTILKTVEPEADIKLDLSPIIRNILTKLTGVQLKKVCKDSRYKNRKKERNIIDGVTPLPEIVTPINPSVWINKQVLTQNLVPKPVLVQNYGPKLVFTQNSGPKIVMAMNLGPKPVITQNFGPRPVLAQNLGTKPLVVQKPVVRSIQNQFPQRNGSKPQPNQQMKVQPASKPNTSNGNTTMKRGSTPVPINMVDKKQKVDDAEQNGGTTNPLKVFIYNETITGGKITIPESLILTKKLLQLIDEDTSNNGHLIRFDRYKLENGIYAIFCANEFAKNWLLEKINLLDNLWPLAALRITQNKLKISKFTRLSVYIPGPVVEPALTILNRIKRQNPLLDTEKWEVIGHYPKKNNGVQLVVGMDAESFNAIQLINMNPYYGLTRITFREKFSLN